VTIRNVGSGVRLLVLAGLVFTLAACGGGGDDSPEPLTQAKAQNLIAQDAGHAVLCVEEVDVSKLDLFDDLQVWKCQNKGKTECWGTRIDEFDGPYVEGRDIAALVPGCPEYDPSEAAGTADESGAASPEEDLAAIQLGRRPSSDDSTLRQISSLLDTMQADCPKNTRRQLADFTANTILLLEDKGISANPAEVLSDVAQSTDLGAISDCRDVFALYVTTRG
jgi:hypothetical protein